MKTSAPGNLDEQGITALLERYECPTSLAAVRTILMRNIASPSLGVSPMAALAMLWGGQLPEFASDEDVQVLVDVLIAGLWNRLAQHHSSRQPFHARRARRPGGHAHPRAHRFRGGVVRQ